MVSEKEQTVTLLVGEGRLVHSLAYCMAGLGQPVLWYSKSVSASIAGIEALAGKAAEMGRVPFSFQEQHLSIVDHLPDDPRSVRWAVVVTGEDPQTKRNVLSELESYLPASALIAVNADSIPLGQLQQDARTPERIVVANWTAPAHRTSFMEVVVNERNPEDSVRAFMAYAKENWDKDPYLVRGDLGIRARLLAALIREAFYLVDNGYASIEDIDRACRNDAGYYLPFVGNFRYMDLMGTYAYGMVMKELNPELSKSVELPRFFRAMAEKGDLGMESGQGFYSYGDGEQDLWHEAFMQFSHKLQLLVKKHIFNRLKDEADY